ncbi:hypothetical protein GDO86_011229 [Hymenochirus boettgeri]|uniref:Nuclear pore complex protein Nup153 n=1 Tax=Hymenochirus boettgeri TaxID=247094 RepID=A0A8T2JAW2_9PIPI|nr:hypothetical protein GDO86_011229 [Hymenochirus boettgeri]
MAAAGGGVGGGGTGAGGKIRSRRYHLSSARTPYSKSRQQQQQSIISRVTDTVKSIVPGWLQKYFNKQDEGSVRTHSINDLVEDTEDRESSSDHQIRVEDEGHLSADCRVTSGPVIAAVEEEPSTSQSALNDSDILTRPSLHRASLNFNMFDSPALHCQPSTSSNFHIGTSGFSLVKEIKDSTSQNDDDNISTTSGFSSRASDKDVGVSKSVSAPPLWSPEVDRSHTLSHNSSVGSKKPSFNLSAFSALSPTLGNTSVLKTSQLGDSPFYPGKTTYQGAAAVHTSRVRSTPYQAPLRRQVKAKPANSQNYGVTSSTARRILQSLEKMSSPLADAKRIPASSSSLTPEKSLVDVIENPSKRKKVDLLHPPVQKLVTPKSISVCASRSLYIKPSLTPSAVANTGGRTVHQEKQRESRRIPVCDVPTSQSFSYPKFSTPASNGLNSGSGGGKMMREKNSHYSKKPSNEEADIPELPEIALPISTTSLPSFKFPVQSSISTSPVTVSKPPDSKTCSLTNSNPLFTFSSPIVKSTESNAHSAQLSVGFTFSVPSVKMSSTTVESKMAAVSSPAKAPIAVSNNSGKKREEEQGAFCQPAKTLKEGSVLDILRSPGFNSLPSQQSSTSTSNQISVPKPAVNSPGNFPFGDGCKKGLGIWQCNACFLENMASQSTCVACSTAKPQAAEASTKLSGSPQHTRTQITAPFSKTQGFGDKFKVPPGTWDCDTCLVQNKSEVTKCVACESPKPGTGLKSALLLLPTTKDTTPIALAPPNVGIISTSLTVDETNRKPKALWECTVCCVQNKAEENICLSCTSERKGTSASTQNINASLTSGMPGLLDQFKKPAGSWDCDVCLVQNKPETPRCIACESPKPGNKGDLKGAVKISVSSAPISSGQLGSLEQFRTPTGGWDCDVCLVQNKADATKCIACENAKPGIKGFETSITSTGTTAPSFKFGVQSSDSSEELKLDASTNLTSSFSFPKPIDGFKFGVTSASTTTDKNNKGFAFGTATNNEISSGFKFGTSNPAQTNLDNNSKPATSSFNSDSSSSTISIATKTPGSGGLQLQSTKDSDISVSAFGVKTLEEKRPEAGFSFSTPFVFGKKDDKTDSTATGSSLLFGVKKDGEEPKQSIFGKAEQTKEDSIKNAPFGFGVLNPSEKKDTEQPTKPAFAFNAQPSTTDAGGSNQSFSFLASGSSTAVSSSSPTVSSSVFASGTQSNTPANSASVFGTGISSNTAGSSGVFGSIASSNAPASSSTLFSSVTPSSTPIASSGLFGSATPSSVPAGSSNLFGTATKLSTPTGSSSVFNSAAPVSTTTSSSNMFGSTPPTNTTNTGNSTSLFGSSVATSSTSTSAFVFGQPSSTSSSSVFGNPSESKSTFAFSGQESKPVTSATAASPFIFGASSVSTTPAASGFNFGQTNPSSVTGSGSSPFMFGSGAPAAAPSGLTVPANPVPAFGQSTNQSSAPAFGSSSSSTSLFPNGNTQPLSAFGSNSVQTTGFGQQPTQPAFGISATPSAGSGFQFGSNANFNFGSTNSSGAVFTFGSNSGSSVQPSTPSFVFNAAAGFNMGTNGRSTPAAISNRKIKTARRRK